MRPFVEKHKEISLKSLGWFFLHHTAVFRARARVLLVGTKERAKGKREGATWVKVTSISHPSVRLAREGEPSRLNKSITSQNRQQVDTLQTRKKKIGASGTGVHGVFVSRKHSFVLKRVTNAICSRLGLDSPQFQTVSNVRDCLWKSLTKLKFCHFLYTPSASRARQPSSLFVSCHIITKSREATNIH